jgi:hypothetical protein
VRSGALVEIYHSGLKIQVGGFCLFDFWYLCDQVLQSRAKAHFKQSNCARKVLIQQWKNGNRQSRLEMAVAAVPTKALPVVLSHEWERRSSWCRLILEHRSALVELNRALLRAELDNYHASSTELTWYCGMSAFATNHCLISNVWLHLHQKKQETTPSRSRSY